MSAPQEGDPARSPRDVESSAPASLLKVLLEMRKEKIIVPSRQIMKMVHEEERLVQLRSSIEAEGHRFVTSYDVSEARTPTRAPLLTQLVEQILEYCRLKLLDDDEDLRDAEDKASASFFREEEREERLAMLLRRCTETYGQLLLAHSEIKPSRRQSRSKRAIEATIEDTRRGGEDSGEEAERSIKPGADTRWNAKHDEASPLLQKAYSGSLPTGSLSPGGAGRFRNSPANHPTPFYETIYALVARAVQQGMRAAAESSKLSHEKGAFAQLAARVEKELACLFRSPQFGRNSGRGLLKGGAKVDASGGSEGIESAQLAARAEAKLNSMIKEAEKLTTKLNSHFEQLESRLQRHAQAEAKQSTDQAEKNPTGGLDNKEALAGNGDHGTSESVDDFIAGFWARAIPKQKDQAISLQNVVGTRSPMISSLLPSPRGQALDMKQKQLNWNLRRRHGAGIINQQSGHSIGMGRPTSGLPPLDSLEDSSVNSSFKNTWAFAQERVRHADIKQPIQAPRILLNMEAPLIV